ncbi:MAG: ATP-binding protein [Ktedonobacterales bacterium]
MSTTSTTRETHRARMPAGSASSPAPTALAAETTVPEAGMPTGLQAALVHSYLKQLRLPAMAREWLPLAREAEAHHSSHLDYLQALLEHEVRERHEHQIQRRLQQARFPYTKRLEDFDFSAVPSLETARVLELAQGAFITQQENLLILGPSGLGKTHLLLGVGRAACLHGYRVLFRTVAALATELELARANCGCPSCWHSGAPIPSSWSTSSATCPSPRRPPSSSSTSSLTATSVPAWR